MSKDNEDHDQGIRIVDKRRFTEEGESKEIPGEAREGSSRPDQPPRDKPQQKPSERPTAREERPVEFSSMIVSLATQALAMLGEVDHPELKQIPVNLGAAKETIDVIAMLETKTKGNLTEDEERLVTEVLSSLRMAFVRKVNEKRK